MTTHEMDPSMFADLAAGGGGPAAIELLARARRSRTVLLLHAVVSLAERSGHPGADLVRGTYEQLRAVPTAALRAVLDYPRVGAWAVRTTARLQSGAPATPEQLTAVLAAARVRAGVEGVVEVPGGPLVVLPSLGTFRPSTSRPVQVVTTASGSVATDGEVRADLRAAGEHWRPVGRLRVEHDGLALVLAVDGTGEQNLPAQVRAHDTLPAGQEDAWWERCSDAWRLLVTRHRPVAEEIAATLSVLTPLSTSGTGHAALTFASAFGCVAMSLPDDPRVMAVALAHEVQHGKLSALLDLFPLVDGLSPYRMHVAWRTDPRPPVAVLQGVYAHLAVSTFWSRYTDREARAEFDRWSTATRAALRSLARSGTLTELGEIFVERMRLVTDSWSDSRNQCQKVDNLNSFSLGMSRAGARRC
ncbi:HEXXH motif-containing putative peptide modification protein [Lentzea sp. NPDC003310]|uniref:aKG-HExxH-type peptide beta-hydroxylase n=1 Tax=Lentzea sp. NPDC003310 TaxID=3154447 RepID=UPI0033B396F2